MASQLQALVDDLADRVGRPVMIDDRHDRAEVYSALQGEADPLRLESILRREVPPEAAAWAATLGIDDASGAVRTPPNPAVGAQARVAIPLRHEGVLLGRMTLLDPAGDLPEESVRLAERAAAEAARIMYQDRLVQDLARGRERELLRDLVAEDANLRRHAATALRQEGLLAAGPVTALMVLRFPAGGGPDALDRAVEWLRRRVAPGHALGLVRFDHALALVVADDAGALAERAGQLRDGALRASGDRRPVVEDERAAPAHGVRTADGRRPVVDDERAAPAHGVRTADDRPVVGIGGPIEHLADAPAGLRQALHAARAAEHVPRFDGIAAWDALGVYRVLTGLAGALDETLLDPALIRLRRADPRGTLVETLETYLDLAGDAQATARRLVLHRAGLYYRLARIREITGLDLKDGEARLGIHLSIKLARLASGSDRSRPGPTAPASGVRSATASPLAGGRAACRSAAGRAGRVPSVPASVAPSRKERS